MKMQTYIGEFTIRDDFDREVVMEVVERDEYRRWGDITINEGDTVLDLGAHIGSFSRLAGSLGARVIAVEPCPANMKLLKANTKGLDVTALQYAINESITSHLLVDSKRNEMHKLVALPQDHTIKVMCITLDRLICAFGNPDIDLLKMDIEGSEYEALYGAGQLRRVKQITMEWHYGAVRMSELIVYLDKLGFRVVWLGGNGSWGHLQLKREESECHKTK